MVKTADPALFEDEPVSSSESNAGLAMRWMFAIVLFIFAIIAFMAPAFLLDLVLDLAVFYLLLMAGYRFVRFFTSGKTRPSDLTGALGAFAFAVVLLLYGSLPEAIIRIAFGAYCALAGLTMGVQILISIYNQTRVRFIRIILCISYCLICVLVLFTPSVSTELLIKMFGVYFLLLGLRLVGDLFEYHSSRYQWKRQIHISLPTLMAALMPDYTMGKMMKAFKKGKEYLPQTQIKKEAQTPLKVMVHVGNGGFQKIGHFTFAWKGVVYSYGNYDTDSFQLFGMLGDGIFFNVPIDHYIYNTNKYEHNSIFEYGITVTKKQEQLIDQHLRQLHNRSYRWYSKLERTDCMSLGALEADYPSRLHWRTGAKFYKIKSGQFKTYWAGGDNCVLFADEILGKIGADVLSLRGLISPGAYFDYLQNELMKENSPVVECTVHLADGYPTGI